jgi:hypothetical protein
MPAKGNTAACSFPELNKKQQKGSKPRCHILTSGEPGDVARRLTTIVRPWGQVLPTHNWMPRGFPKMDIHWSRVFSR